MKVKFLGIKQQKKRSGCPVCGSRRVSETEFQRTKQMVLPSGRTIFFSAGETYEVSDGDGKFLLGQAGTKIFEKVI